MPEIGPNAAMHATTAPPTALFAARAARGTKRRPLFRAQQSRYAAAAPHDFHHAGGATFSAPRLVLAAGLGNKELGAQAGLNMPVKPERGQILVTERVKPVLGMLTLLVRQMAEGSLMIGESHEDVGLDDATTPEVQQALAVRAVRTFPFLRDVRVVRHWAALRVLAPDGLPIYEQSQQYPGASAATCHSGATLAAAHALRYAGFVADGALPAELARFTGQRFNVQKAA